MWLSSPHSWYFPFFAPPKQAGEESPIRKAILLGSCPCTPARLSLSVCLLWFPLLSRVVWPFTFFFLPPTPPCTDPFFRVSWSHSSEVLGWLASLGTARYPYPLPHILPHNPMPWKWFFSACFLPSLTLFDFWPALFLLPPLFFASILTLLVLFLHFDYLCSPPNRCERYELKIDYVAMDQVCTWSHY